MKISITGIEARDKAFKGAKYVAQAVKSTMGPFGQNALIENGNKISNDGYLISSELVPTVKDEFERRGATIGHEASAKTNEQVGDATSTSWALTDAILDEASRYLPNKNSLVAKKTPSQIAKMIETSKNNVISLLKESATPILDKETLIKSALVSVEDEGIAELLGETQWEIGPDGEITVEEVNDVVSKIERVNGIKIDNGFSNSVVITNPEKGSLEITDSAVILTNYTIGIEELGKMKDSIFATLLSQKQNSIAIIARAFTPDAIQLCIDSHKAGLRLYPINAPYTDQQEIMRDLEAVVGGRYIDSEEARLDDMYITDVGYIKSLVAGRFDAIITGVEDDRAKERITKRVEVLQARLQGQDSDFMKKMYRTRIAQFEGGFAILKVGSPSLVDRKRLKDKCDDAVNSVRLALKGGTVKGAGVAFKDISDTLADDDILKRPLLSVYNQIIISAPEDFVIEDWVRDPVLVLISALENACSVAGTLSSVSIVIAEENPKRKDED
jgi:chaperonin GroEL